MVLCGDEKTVEAGVSRFAKLAAGADESGVPADLRGSVYKAKLKKEPAALEQVIQMAKKCGEKKDC